MPHEDQSQNGDFISIFVSAGDPSGDIAGYHLLKNMITKCPGLRFFGLGGRRMKSLGQEQLIDGDRLAIIGFWEVAKKFIFFRRLMNRTIDEVAERKPRAIVLIDYPGFNLRLAARLKNLGIPIIYYVSPQIWAWGGQRLKEIKRLVDTMLLILPFEKKIYDEAGITNRFIGHYLMDDIDRDLIKAPYNINSNLIALLPGSRPQEVAGMLPVLIRAARRLQDGGRRRFAIAAVEGGIDYESFTASAGMPIEIARGRTRQLIADSRLAITSSGTATLEIGIIGRPMVVIYKTGWLTYMIARRLVTIDKIALINIAAGKKIVPELIQNDVTEEAIVSEACKFLDNPELSLRTVKELNGITETLGAEGAGAKAADVIREYARC